MPMPAACQVAVLTARGRGAVATIALRGPAAAELVARHLNLPRSPEFTQASLGTIRVGHWSSTSGEEVVAVRRTEAIVELHCHGGWAAVEAIVRHLVESGAERVDPWSWGQHEILDPIAEAADRALTEAHSLRASVILAEQRAGALRRTLESVERELHRGDVTHAREQLARLQANAVIGLHLTTPWRVALVGAPNVGKSSLINALMGYSRTVVHPRPGSTRDVVTAITALDGWPVELADTAGICVTQDRVEAAGVDQTHRQVDEADLVVWVDDDWAAPETQIPTHALRVLNKVDLLSALQREAATDAFDLLVSAHSREGIDVLAERIVAAVVPRVPARGEAVPFTKNQRDAIEQATIALDAGDLLESAAVLKGLRQ